MIVPVINCINFVENVKCIFHFLRINSTSIFAKSFWNDRRVVYFQRCLCALRSVRNPFSAPCHQYEIFIFRDSCSGFYVASYAPCSPLSTFYRTIHITCTCEFYIDIRQFFSASSTFNTTLLYRVCLFECNFHYVQLYNNILCELANAIGEAFQYDMTKY